MGFKFKICLTKQILDVNSNIYKKKKEKKVEEAYSHGKSKIKPFFHLFGKKNEWDEEEEEERKKRGK